MSFVHLHVHTQYSILDGAARIKSLYSKKDKSKRLITGLIDKAKELDMPGIAITDHGNMFGVMEFYTEAKAKGIIPIIGSEVYVAPKSRLLKAKDSTEEKSAMHLVLLAKDKEGYDNLTKLVTLGYTEGFYYRPRIDHELIEKHNKGLICLSACMGGEIPMALRKKNFELADKLTSYYKSVFGKDFYIELQDHGMEEERSLNILLYKLAKKHSLPMVVTNDVHYISKDDAKAHEILMAIQTKTTLDSPKRFKFPTDDFHLKTEEEMKKSFGKISSAFENTVKIAEECSGLDILSKTYYMPDYKLESGETERSTLQKLCMKGLNKYYNNDIPQVALERLEMELNVISEMGFEGYFLIVQDFIKYARDNDISVGPGRGSAAGSIVAFATAITKVNPLEYNLLFERFLNPERKSMPDIDIDFQDDKRDDVIEYVKNKYGKDNVAQIATFSSLSGRSVIRDVCRVMNIELSIADSIAKLMPSSGTLLDIYNDPLQKDFRREIDARKEHKDMFEIATKLEGLVRNVGLHAAGIVISNKKLVECVPIYQDNKTGVRASQYEMEHIEKAGLIKIDLLGIKNLRLVKDAVEDIKRRYGVSLDVDNLPLDDKKVYKIFQAANTGGIFQFESDGMRKMLMDIKPTTFDDLVSSVALYRPGPINAGMGKKYADTKNGKIKQTYTHPDLEPILRETQGVLIYQEQIMAISRVLGGFTPAEADDLRKAMGKKNIEAMEKLKEKFISGGLERGYEKKILDDLYEMMRGFAEYGFNKSHSVCYALIAYQEAYIKAHYQTEYYVALLNTTINDTDKIAIYLNEIRQNNIGVIMPSVFESNALFSQKDGNIVYALHAVKGIGLQAALAIENERNKNGEFKSLEDFANRVSVQLVSKKVYESLIKSEAFSGFGHSMSSLLASIDTITAYASSYQNEVASGQAMLFDSASGNSAGLGINLENLIEFQESELREHEIMTLGFSFIYNPFARYSKLIDYKYFHNTSDFKELSTTEQFLLPCVIETVRNTMTKTKIPMLIIDVLDSCSTMTFFIKGVKDIEKFESYCTVGNAVLIKGKREKSRYDDRIYSNISEITPLESGIKDAKNDKFKPVKREVVVPKPEALVPTEVNQKKDEGSNSNYNDLGKITSEVKYDAKFSKAIEIKVDQRSFDIMDLHFLEAAIHNYPGDCTIYIKMMSEHESKKLMIGDGFRVNPNDGFFTLARENLRSLIDISHVS